MTFSLGPKVPWARSAALRTACNVPMGGHDRRRARPPPVDPAGSTEGTLLASVTRVLGLYVRDTQPTALFQDLLGDLLALTGSEYGYIAECLVDEHGAPYLQTWAITNIAWDLPTRTLYEDNVVVGEGLEFRNLDTLFGWALRHREVVISNDALHDHRAGRPATGPRAPPHLPRGPHPPA